jgi:predicted Zn-ribbon and HTH transcriptional regulator
MTNAAQDDSVRECKCRRCGYKWNPRGEEKPRYCAKCKSSLWDRPRKQTPHDAWGKR